MPTDYDKLAAQFGGNTGGADKYDQLAQQYGASPGRAMTSADIPVSAEERAFSARQKVPQAQPEDSAIGKLWGVVEAPVSMASGMIGGAVGSIAGAGKALLGGHFGTQQGIREGDQFAGQVADAMTYQSRTQTGNKLLQVAGEALHDSGVVGVPIPELNALGRGAASSSQALRGLAQPSAAAQAAQDAVMASGPKQSVRALIGMPQKQMTGVGAAMTEDALLRAQRAQSMPVPIQLTKGQLTRDRQQVAFERETAKQKEGAPLASAYEDQNARYMQNLDAFTDETGAQNLSTRAVGKSFVGAVGAKAKASLKRVDAMYDEARAAGEMVEPVDVTALTDWVAKNKGKDKIAPIISTIESELKQNAKVDGGGYDPLTLMPRPKRTLMTLDASEDLRQAIGKLSEPGTPNVVYGNDAKKLIDAAQDGKGGDLFRQARRAYENHANEFTNRDVIDRALRTKPGTKDRAVAYEDIFKNTILNGSTDDVRHVFRVLEAHPKGQDEAIVAAGKQAASDLRGAVVSHIKDEMQKNLNVDSKGARTGSPAKIDSIVRELDKDGKLEVIFGKEDAQKIRDVRDVAIDLYTNPNGTVNYSNTASALLRRMDDIAGYTKATPVIGKVMKYTADQIRSVNTSRKVRDALTPYPQR